MKTASEGLLENLTSLKKWQHTSLNGSFASLSAPQKKVLNFLKQVELLYGNIPRLDSAERSIPNLWFDHQPSFCPAARNDASSSSASTTSTPSESQRSM